jgi:hypothetical protein
MADTPLFKKFINFFVKERRLMIVSFIGGMVANEAVHYSSYGFWGSLAIGLGAFVIYLFIVGLLQHAWAHRPPN